MKRPKQTAEQFKILVCTSTIQTTTIFLRCILSRIVEIMSNCHEKNYGLGCHCIAVNAVDYQLPHGHN